MKTANTVVLALCLLLAAGSAAAQENQMGTDARNHDASSASHGSMKKTMEHGSMKMGMKTKSGMTNDGAAKSQDMMKHDTTGQAGMGDQEAQH